MTLTQAPQLQAGESLLFVYGTLKHGFRNAAINHGRRLPGDFVTCERWPLYIIGPWRLPWLVDRVGLGERVSGQLFAVDAPTLAGMDELELVHLPGWYRRSGLRVRGGSGGPAWSAQVYFGCAQRCQSDTVHAGPLGEYTLEHDAHCSDDGLEELAWVST